MSTSADLAREVLELDGRATPGPWRHGTHAMSHVFVHHVGGMCHVGGVGPERVLLRMNEDYPHDADAGLIAHYRLAAPTLARALLAAEGGLRRPKRGIAMRLMTTAEMDQQTGWSARQRNHLRRLIKGGATIAYVVTDQHGRPSNGGPATREWQVRPGLVQQVDGPLRLCGPHALHGTYAPHKWRGERVWVAGFVGEVACKNDKIGSLRREIVGEVYPECALDGSVGVRVGRKDLYGADLSGANLFGVYLGGADMRGVDLRGANFCGANLSCANLSNANLSCANLSNANLHDANLRGADLCGANLDGAYLPNASAVPAIANAGFENDAFGYLRRSLAGRERSDG